MIHQDTMPTCSRSESSNSIASEVMATNESPRSAVAIEQRERRAAPARAGYIGIWLTRSAQVVTGAVLAGMLPARQHLQIFGSIVLLVAIDVMNDFATPQRAPESLRRDEAMLIHIAAAVGHRMAWTPDQNVSSGCNGPTAFPIWIGRAELSDSIAHQMIIAIRRDQHAYQN